MTTINEVICASDQSYAGLYLLLFCFAVAAVIVCFIVGAVRRDMERSQNE